MEREDIDRILDYIVEYFYGRSGEEVKKETSSYFLKKGKRVKSEKRNE